MEPALAGGKCERLTENLDVTCPIKVVHRLS